MRATHGSEDRCDIPACGRAGLPTGRQAFHHRSMHSFILKKSIFVKEKYSHKELKTASYGGFSDMSLDKNIDLRYYQPLSYKASSMHSQNTEREEIIFYLTCHSIVVFAMIAFSYSLFALTGLAIR